MALIAICEVFGHQLVGASTRVSKDTAKILRLLRAANLRDRAN
jgi:hypothetical protein